MSADRLALNWAIFREVNERIQELSLRQDLVPWTERTAYCCECGAPECLETVELTLAEFEAIRSDDSTYVISPDHAPAPALVVEATERYIVAERSEG